MNFNGLQEIDLATETIRVIQSGSRKILGKANPVHALQVHNGLIYAASSPLDGAAVKVSCRKQDQMPTFVSISTLLFSVCV